jgi:hypothetical protein
MAIHSAIDGESGRQARGAIREIGRGSSSFAHRGKANFWFEGANEYRLRIARVTGDDVEAPVHPIDEVNLGRPRWTEHGIVS